MSFELFGTIIVGLLGIALICQGYFIMYGKHGYSKHDHTSHEKRERMRQRLANMLKE